MSILSVCTYKVNGAGGDFPATVVCSLKLSWSEEYPRQWRGYLRCLCLIICLKWESCPDLASTCRKSIYRPPVDFQNPWHSECLSRCIRFHEEGIWCGCQFLSAGLTNKLVPSCTSIRLSHPETQLYLIIWCGENPVFFRFIFLHPSLCTHAHVLPKVHMVLSVLLQDHVPVFSGRKRGSGCRVRTVQPHRESSARRLRQVYWSWRMPGTLQR